MNITTLGQLEYAFRGLLLLGDTDVIKLVIGVVVANQIDSFDPFWLLLVSAPSSGKTEILQALNDIMNEQAHKPIITPISDLTVNTFASGQIRVGEETSLLHRMPRGGIMVFKDFTSLLSKNDDARKEIMGQMREIYDKSYSKLTGNNKDINWNGKIGALAGCTEVIYEHLESLSAMGDRFAMYSIVQPDRRQALKFVINSKRNGENKEEMRLAVRLATKLYVEHILRNMEKFDLKISPEAEDEIIDIADFCTKVRSGVIINKKTGGIDFVPSKEMPMRLTEQLVVLGTAFVIMRKVESGGECSDELTPNDLAIIQKVGFDSIPIKRRMALKLLAAYGQGARTAGLAASIGYETRVVGGWLYQLNGLGICDRKKMKGPQGDLWILRPEYVEMMVKFDKITVMDRELIDENLPETDAADKESLDHEYQNEDDKRDVEIQLDDIF